LPDSDTPQSFLRCGFLGAACSATGNASHFRRDRFLRLMRTCAMQPEDGIAVMAEHPKSGEIAV
jgi:hypothetical protein